MQVHTRADFATSMEQKELRIIKRMEDRFIFVTIERNYIQGVNTFVLISLKNKF